MLAFANFGSALRSSADSAKSSSSAVLDYSRQDLSVSSEAREKVHTPSFLVLTVEGYCNVQGL